MASLHPRSSPPPQSPSLRHGKPWRRRESSRTPSPDFPTAIHKFLYFFTLTAAADCGGVEHGSGVAVTCAAAGWLRLSAPVATNGAEGSAVAGSGNGNSVDPSASQHATPTSQAATPTSQVTSGRAGCKRKLTSAVWKEMESIFENGEWKAECNYCHKKFTSGPRAGTNHLCSHLDSCPARHAPMGPKQQKLRLTKGEGGKVNLENVIFDQEKARKDLALMICEHEYPLSIVDHSGFRRFCSSLQPLFKMVCINTIRNDIVAMHSAQREKMVNFFATFKNRVAITTDLWTSGYQKRGYMAVTAHYIDDSWNLKSFLMRFAYVPCPHSAEVICEALYECLVEWHLERKISTITLDNCTSNDKAMVILPDKLDTSSLLMNGQLLHMRCAAHILNLIVKDGMSVLEHGIERVRDSVAFWSSHT